MIANIKGQGDPLGLVEARGETYADFVTAITSTPSIGIVDTEVDPVNGLEFWKPGEPENIESPIWRLWQQGTRHHFAWPCPHCGEYFVPRFKHLALAGTCDAGTGPARRLRLLPALRRRDRRRPQAGDDRGRRAGCARARRSRRRAKGATNRTTRRGPVGPPGLCSPFVTFGERAERYLTALNSGEPDKIQTVMNAGFGELLLARGKPETLRSGRR